MTGLEFTGVADSPVEKLPLLSWAASLSPMSPCDNRGPYHPASPADHRRCP